MLLGHYQVAANHFQAALRAESSAKVAFNLGLAYQRLGQNPESESAYRHALELNPLYTEAQQNLATVLNAQQRYSGPRSCVSSHQIFPGTPTFAPT